MAKINWAPDDDLEQYLYKKGEIVEVVCDVSIERPVYSGIRFDVSDPFNRFTDFDEGAYIRIKAGTLVKIIDCQILSCELNRDYPDGARVVQRVRFVPIGGDEDLYRGASGFVEFDNYSAPFVRTKAGQVLYGKKK